MTRYTLILAFTSLLAGTAGHAADRCIKESDHVRARDLGIAPGVLARGPLDAISPVRARRLQHRVVRKHDSYRCHGDCASTTAQYAQISNDNISPLFEAAVEATEEAIYNSLFMASTTRNHDVIKNEDVVIERLPLAPFLKGRKHNCR